MLPQAVIHWRLAPWLAASLLVVAVGACVDYGPGYEVVESQRVPECTPGTYSCADAPDDDGQDIVRCINGFRREVVRTCEGARTSVGCDGEHAESVSVCIPGRSECCVCTPRNPNVCGEACAARLRAAEPDGGWEDDGWGGWNRDGGDADADADDLPWDRWEPWYDYGYPDLDAFLDLDASVEPDTEPDIEPDAVPDALADTEAGPDDATDADDDAADADDDADAHDTRGADDVSESDE